MKTHSGLFFGLLVIKIIGQSDYFKIPPNGNLSNNPTIYSSITKNSSPTLLS
jgi:hypothetical protein